LPRQYPGIIFEGLLGNQLRQAVTTVFNKMIVAMMPMVPKSIIRQISRRYIAGDVLQDAIDTTVRLHREEGAWSTIDVLGEFVEDRGRALKEKNASLAVLQAIDSHQLKHVAGLSLKPTSLGLGIDPAFGTDNIREVVTRGRDLGIVVNIDMENTPYTDATLAVYRRLREEGFTNVALVIQAMLRRSERDVRDLFEYRPTVRLCKGIYREARTVAFVDREEVRANYRKLLRLMLEGGFYPAIATHDDPLIADARALIKERGLRPDQYEFQMLLGVKEQVRRRILADGHQLRVYVPFGEDWYGYSTRRLKENPEMAGMIAKAVLLRQ
jgi:proline dehydrogenase